MVICPIIEHNDETEHYSENLEQLFEKRSADKSAINEKLYRNPLLWHPTKVVIKHLVCELFFACHLRNDVNLMGALFTYTMNVFCIQQ